MEWLRLHKLMKDLEAVLGSQPAGFDSVSADNVACACCFEDPWLPRFSHSSVRSMREQETREDEWRKKEAAARDWSGFGGRQRREDLDAVLGDQPAELAAAANSRGREQVAGLSAP